MTTPFSIKEDHTEILTLIAQQFQALSWTEKTAPNVETLLAGYLPDAPLFSSARPAKAQSPHSFAKRMTSLQQNGTLRSFTEQGRGIHIWITGQVAVAMAGCEMRENHNQIAEDISAFLLVKNPGGWIIAAQAWDILPSITDAFAANDLRDDSF